MDSPISDRGLWQLVTAGDVDAFARLYERRAVGVESFCLRRTADRALAEEATAEVFLERWRRRNRLTLLGSPGQAAAAAAATSKGQSWCLCGQGFGVAGISPT